MIKILEGFPQATVAIACEGRITRSDYEKIVIPRVEAALAHHDRIRIYYQIGPSCDGFEPGAVWEDTKLGLEHLRRFEKMAVVTDVQWIRAGVDLFRIVMPARLRVYPLSEAQQAREWICADQ